MFIASPAPLVTALGWALLHSLWQSLIIFACLRLLLYTFRKAPAALRYHLSLIALLGAGGCFFITLRQQWMTQSQSLSYGLPANSGAQTFTFVAGGSTAHPAAFTGIASGMLGIEHYFPYLVLLYGIGLLWCCMQTGSGWISLHRIRSQRLQPFDTAWEHHLRRLSERLGVRKKVRLFLSGYVDVPLMAGYLKPAIYLPLAAVNNLSPEQIEAILLHELAHVKRNDYLLNILQTLVETLLFFNPFVKWISRHIREERELSCDEMVISVAQPEAYAHALVALEDMRHQTTLLAMSAVDGRTPLLHRIKHIMEMKTKKIDDSRRLLALLVLVLSITSIAWLAPAATHPAEKKKSATISKALPNNALLLQHPVKDTVIVPAAPLPSAEPPASADVAPKAGEEKASPSLTQAPVADTQLSEAEKEKITQKIVQMREKARQQMAHMHVQMDSLFAQRKDWEQMRLKVQQQMLAAQQKLQKFDWKKADVERNMAFARMQADSALRNINWDLIRLQTERSMHAADSALRNIDWKKINLQSAEAMKRANEAIDRAGRNWNWDNNNALVMHRGHILSPEAMIDELNRDGLLKSKDRYKVELTNKALYIDGKKQPSSTYEKYRRLMGEHTTLKMEKKKGHASTSITMEDNS